MLLRDNQMFSSWWGIINSRLTPHNRDNRKIERRQEIVRRRKYRYVNECQIFGVMAIAMGRQGWAKFKTIPAQLWSTAVSFLRFLFSGSPETPRAKHQTDRVRNASKWPYRGGARVGRNSGPFPPKSGASRFPFFEFPLFRVCPDSSYVRIISPAETVLCQNGHCEESPELGENGSELRPPMALPHYGHFGTYLTPPD